MTETRDQIYEGADLSDAEIAAATKFAAEKPSTSYLQRKMQIPYSHAMRLMDYMEACGVVSPRNAVGLRTWRGEGK